MNKENKEILEIQLEQLMTVVKEILYFQKNQKEDFIIIELT
jgi:hypothetical protein